MKDDKTLIEIVVLLALIKATSNQCLMIEPKELRNQFKQSFNVIRNEGNKMYKSIEKTSELNSEVYDDILDQLENNIAEMRKIIKFDK